MCGFDESTSSTMKYFDQLSSFVSWSTLHLQDIVLLLLALYLFYKLSSSQYRGRWKLPPGPYGLPLVGYLPFLGLRPYETVAKMRKKYGDIIGLKFGRNFIVILNEFKVLKEGLSHSAALNRPNIFGDLNFGFGFANGQAWKEQRRFVLQAMKNLGLGREPWESLTKESIVGFIKQVKSYKGKPVDINVELEGCLSNDLMSFVYGKKFHPENDKEEINELARFSDFISKHIGPCSYGCYIPGFFKFCELFNVGEYRGVAECIKKYHALTKNEIEKHLQNKDCQNLRDFLNMYKEKMKLMETSKEKHYFTDDFMLGNANVLFLGGTSTTVNTMLALFRLMAANLDAQKQVHKELDSVIGRDGSISYAEKFKVPYTFAAMLEAQRYFCVAPFTSNRILSEHIELEGYFIPKGSHIIGNTWAVHHDPENWQDPHLFQPERFLTEDKTEIVKNPSNFIPFSIGRRNCIGDSIAYITMFTYFTSVMQRFEISAPPGMQLTFNSTFGLSAHISPQPLCFTERV